MTSVTATSVACSISVGDNIILIDNMTQCSFGVQSVVCATLSGVPSTPLNVTLKGIISQIIYILCTYMITNY
jgi:hypothetical protein